MIPREMKMQQSKFESLFPLFLLSLFFRGFTPLNYFQTNAA